MPWYWRLAEFPSIQSHWSGAQRKRLPTFLLVAFIYAANLRRFAGVTLSKVERGSPQPKS
jgi:hypothetical protein